MNKKINNYIRETLDFVYHNVSLSEPRNLWDLKRQDPLALDEIMKELEPPEEDDPE